MDGFVSSDPDRVVVVFTEKYCLASSYHVRVRAVSCSCDRGGGGREEDFRWEEWEGREKEKRELKKGFKKNVGVAISCPCVNCSDSAERNNG